MIKGFKPRIYQETIMGTASLYNTLCVLPTGLGKTNIALMLCAQRLRSHPDSKILFLAPTKPLVEQHFSYLKSHFSFPEEKITFFTGAITPEKRKVLWNHSQIIFSTPQSIENDLISNKIELKDVSLLVIDEAHRAVKDYSYVWLCKRYFETAKYSRILGLTASPGSDSEKINEVCKNLYIEEIEIRTDNDPDVKPYIQNIHLDFINVELPEEMKRVKKFLEDCLKSKLQLIKSLGYSNRDIVSRTDLLSLQGQMQGSIAQGDRSIELLKSISLGAEALKIQHAQELLETQCLSSLKTYFESIMKQALTTKVKATKNLALDTNFRSAAFLTSKLHGEGLEHPKLEKLKSLVEDTINQNSKSKIIVFSQFRDTVDKIIEELDTVDNCTPRQFIGQAKKKKSGMSQKEQVLCLQDFKEGKFNILVASSVGEEGLDIPQVDEVIFYEPVPSAIRHIQRRGRTGRLEKGSVKVLVAQATRDESYRWSAFHKQQRMIRTLKSMKNNFSLKKTYDKPIINEENISIFADAREKGSLVLKDLVNNNVKLELRNLNCGDFIVSKRCCIEYKKVEDFANSIIDGRLLSQLKALTEQFDRPLIIIEGEQDLFSVRNIHPNAVRGMLSTITVSYRVPILSTKNAKESSALIIAIAKREQSLDVKDFALHALKPKSMKENQEFIVSALPGIGLGLAKDLLNSFGNIRNIMKANEKELKDIKMLGDQKVKSISEVLDFEYKN